MTPTDTWRAALTRSARARTLTQSTAILAAALSLLLIAMGAGLDGWVGTLTGVGGLVGAGLLWWEV